MSESLESNHNMITPSSLNFIFKIFFHLIIFKFLSVSTKILSITYEIRDSTLTH